MNVANESANQSSSEDNRPLVEAYFNPMITLSSLRPIANITRPAFAESRGSFAFTLPGSGQRMRSDDCRGLRNLRASSVARRNRR